MTNPLELSEKVDRRALSDETATTLNGPPLLYPFFLPNV